MQIARHPLQCDSPVNNSHCCFSHLRALTPHTLSPQHTHSATGRTPVHTSAFHVRAHRSSCLCYVALYRREFVGSSLAGCVRRQALLKRTETTRCRTTTSLQMTYVCHCQALILQRGCVHCIRPACESARHIPHSLFGYMYWVCMYVLLLFNSPMKR